MGRQKENGGCHHQPVIEHAFEVATQAGAVAGKVSGAGGGGFCMFMVEPTKKKAVINALKQLMDLSCPSVYRWRSRMVGRFMKQTIYQQ